MRYTVYRCDRCMKEMKGDDALYCKTVCFDKRDYYDLCGSCFASLEEWLKRHGEM